MSAFPKIKLTYFHFAARAEAARLAFYVGGVPFIDERVTLEQFGAMKENLPLGQLPILEVDGQVLTQSEAILRYAGRLGGLYPVNAPLAALKIDEVISALAEVAAQMSTSFREQDPAKKKALREELATATIPRYATLIEARLEQLKKHSVFDTTQLFIHEISLYTWAKWLRSGVLDHIPTTILDGYTLINAAADKVSENTKVKEWYSMPHAMPKLKLTNLALPDRGEPARLALFIGDVPFEHERISNEELAKRKPSLPFNQLPVLEVDGEVISQSLAILRYAGSLAGLYQTNDPLEAYKIDEVFALVDDMYNSWRPAFQEKDPIKQLELLKRMAETTIPTILGFLEKRVGAWDGQYATGSRLTVADLAIYSLLSGLKSGRLQGVPTTVTEPFKRLEQVHDKVKAHPKVVEWYEKNPSPVIP